MGKESFGISPTAITESAKAIARLIQEGKEIAVVVGAGNLFRGVSLHALGFKKTTGDAMGMLATMINGLALQEALQKEGLKAVLMSSIFCPKVSELFEARAAISHLEAGAVVICVGGTGNPFFTTDTAAALRGCELEVDVLLKATKVDGVYSKDPHKHKDAKRYSNLSYNQMIDENLQVMDSSAVILCRQNDLPIFVFHMEMLNQPANTWMGNETYGTLVTRKE